MIKVVFLRNHSGRNCDPMVNEQTAVKALESLVKFEIGYGGHIAKLEKTEISIVTRVMGCVDTTTFSGTEEEMTLLVLAAGIHLLLLDETAKRNDGAQFTQSELDRIMEVTKGNPLMLKMGADLILGGMRVPRIYVAMLDPQSEEEAKKLFNIASDDLYAMVCLKHEQNLSLAELLELQTA